MKATVTITCEPEEYVRIRLAVESAAATYKQEAKKPENESMRAELTQEAEIHYRMWVNMGEIKS